MNEYTFTRLHWGQVMFVANNGGEFTHIGELFVSYFANRPIHKEWNDEN
jgi:hypothetical protein